MGAVYEYERVVEWGDCDPHGFIFFPNYYRWMTEGYHQMMRKLAIDIVPHLEEWKMRGTPALAMNARYAAPARLEDLIRHRLEITEVRTRSFTVTHRFLCGETLLMEAHDSKGWAVVSLQKPVTIDLVAMPEDVKAKLRG
ncbi:MAG TPA: hotdog domain-containing protein [Hyphomicrobiales bacterium]|nr:hotdog domain-containing protein [Hyphomicrobiales bacterium]